VPGVAQACDHRDQSHRSHSGRSGKACFVRLTLEDPGEIGQGLEQAPKGTIFTDTIGFTIAANDQLTEPSRSSDVVLAYRNGAPLPS